MSEQGREWTRYLNGERNTFPSFKEFYQFATSGTPLEENPSLREPREIRHVVWDADETIWTIKPGNVASGCHPPFNHVDEDTVQANCEGNFRRSKKRGRPRYVTVDRPSEIRLRPSLRDTLGRLESMGIRSSIASQNAPGSVEAIIEAFGLTDKFDVIKSTHELKAHMVADISEITGIPSEEMLFIDDIPGNVSEVTEDTGALGLCIDRDIDTPGQVLDFIKRS